jgi:hypothetical protein
LYRLLRYGAWLLLVVLLAACGAGAESDGKRWPSHHALDGHVFVVDEALDAGRPRVLHSQVLLRFEDGRSIVSTGCNRSTGTYAIDGGRITFAGVGGTTFLGCADELLEQEGWVDRALGARPTLTFDGATAELGAGDAVLRGHFRDVDDADERLVGRTWRIERHVDDEGRSSVQPWMEASEVRFDREGDDGGAFSVRSPCGRLEGRYYLEVRYLQAALEINRACVEGHGEVAVVLASLWGQLRVTASETRAILESYHGAGRVELVAID